MGKARRQVRSCSGGVWFQTYRYLQLFYCFFILRLCGVGETKKLVGFKT